MHQFIQDYWSEYFPKLPAYQTFVARLNRLEATFQSLGPNCRPGCESRRSRK
jgi:hypothetical protein